MRQSNRGSVSHIRQTGGLPATSMSPHMVRLAGFADCLPNTLLVKRGAPPTHRELPFASQRRA
jgi:hypothetical protein